MRGCTRSYAVLSEFESRRREEMYQVRGRATENEAFRDESPGLGGPIGEMVEEARFEEVLEAIGLGKLVRNLMHRKYGIVRT